MIRRQFINTIRRYSHNNSEKNFPQIICNNFFEKNEQKLDLIQKQLLEDNKKINDNINNVQDCINILFTFNFFTTIVLLIKSV